MNTTVVKMSENIPQPASESAAALSMIERIARDPSIDIARLQEMQSLYERIREREAKNQFNDAMAAAQAEMTTISTDSGNPQTRSKYASLAAIDRALRPIYTKHGFGVSFDEGDNIGPDRVRVLAYVSCAGHDRTYHLDMPADGKGARGNDVMTKTHATMSAVTYGRRGLLKMIFNIAEDDDDGNNASRRVVRPDTADDEPLINSEQLEIIQNLLMQVPGDFARNIQTFCTVYRCDGIERLKAADFERAKRSVEKKIP